MGKISFANSNNRSITMSAVLNLPPGFDEGRKYPAIVVSHPGGGVKEQTAGTYAKKAGTYAKKLAEQGFVTIAYDASYQGESGGEPRQLENPSIRTEDVSAVLDHLITLAYVDAERIGGMGICAGAGYTVNAAIDNPRIKAVGTVSMVNIGQMFRNGFTGEVKSPDAAPLLQAGAKARTSQTSGSEIETMPLAPMRKEDAPNEDLEEAWEYYHTPRAQYPTAPGWATARSLSQIIPYDAFLNPEAFLTQPLLMVVGSEAGSKWMSDDLLKRAASTDKALHVVQASNHMKRYDVARYVDEAVSVLAPFFRKYLADAGQGHRVAAE